MASRMRQVDCTTDTAGDAGVTMALKSTGQLASCPAGQVACQPPAIEVWQAVAHPGQWPMLPTPKLSTGAVYSEGSPVGGCRDWTGGSAPRAGRRGPGRRGAGRTGTAGCTQPYPPAAFSWGAHLAGLQQKREDHSQSSWVCAAAPARCRKECGGSGDENSACLLAAAAMMWAPQHWGALPPHLSNDHGVKPA